MADVSEVLTAFRAELVAAAIVRRPSETGTAGGPPPMHLSPIDGPPAPGQREGVENDPDLVLSLLYAGDVAAPSGYDAAQRQRIILDVRIRARDTTARRRGMAVASAITGRLIRPETNYGYGFMLGGRRVLEVSAEGGGPVSSSLAAGFDDLAKYRIEVPR
jgi:hypothetical protein